MENVRTRPEPVAAFKRFLTGPLVIVCLAGLGGTCLSQRVWAEENQPGSSPVTASAPEALVLHLTQRAALKSLTEVSSNSAKTETVLLDETFEGTWPTTPWRVYHGPNAADVDWGRSDYRASDQSFSMWCAASGSEAPDAGDVAPLETASWTVAGPFDLTEATTGSLTFDLWLKTDLIHDNFMWLASIDGENFSGRARSTDSDGWTTITADLVDWHDGLDLTGRPLVWIAFVYLSDHTNQFEGAYVDQVRLVADSGEQGTTGRTYSSDEDFESGTMVGMESGSGTLTMSESWSALPYLWMPSISTGTVSKVDTDTGAELARYRTGPDEITLGPTPAAVSLDGSCWVGNRSAGTLVKIGLYENGGCIDQNGNGSIETSLDANGDGDISDGEMLDWGEDECVLLEVVLVAGSEGVHTPGDQHDDYSNIGILTLVFETETRLWAGIGGSHKITLVDGGSGEILKSIDLGTPDTRPLEAVVDADGALWCSAWPDPWILNIDTETDEIEVLDLIHGSYGLALDAEQHLFISGYQHSVNSRVDLDAGEVDLQFNADYEASDMAVTENGYLLVAGTASQIVRRYSTNGVASGLLNFGNRPSGLALDGFGKIWVVGENSGVLVRFDPQTMLVELQKSLLNIGGFDPTGDLTGLVARSITTPYGSWSVIFDSQQVNTAWGTLSWISEEPDETTLRVRVRSSHDQILWAAWEIAGNEIDLQSTPAGRYLEIEVSMKSFDSETSPTLDEITVTPEIEDGIPEALFSWLPAEPLGGQAVQFSDESSGQPTTWAWDFGDGDSSTDQNPRHVFSIEGSYTVNLTAGNDAGEDTVTEEIIVSRRGGIDIPAIPVS